MKRKKELIVILSSLLVIVLSVSVAYFTTKILGTEKEISVESADLKVIFTSGSGTINGSNIEPGWTSGENTFTVKNESNGTYKYNVIIKDLVNTFVTEGFLQYKITSTDGGYNMTDFADVPKSSTAYNAVIAQEISIEKGVTHTYKIIINYNNSDNVDQSADMGKKLSDKIFIEKYTQTLASKLLEDNPTISERNDFGKLFVGNLTRTMYKSIENGTDVYYFAGVDSTDAGCVYDGYKIKDIVKLNKNTCLSEMELCKTASNMGMYIYGYNSDDCADYHQGTIITVNNAKWTESAYALINNWVKLGNYYWRIIRTNADGSIRLLYSGTSPDTTEGYIGKSTFNTYKTKSPKYVGYMYGNSDTTLEEARTNTNDSTIKTYIDNWYKNNLTSYTNYLSNDAVYCNDRELRSGDTYSTSSSFNFKPTERLTTNKKPTYDCTNKKDAFSVNNAEAKLKYPIALMTADEVLYAGEATNTSTQTSWYYTNSTYNNITSSNGFCLLSPDFYGGRSVYYYAISVSDTLNSVDVAVSQAIRPVTSLKSCVQWKSGDGSASNPYEIVENGGC